MFENENVNVGLLRKKAFNYRWATLPEEVIPLTAADPDFPIAEEIRNAIRSYTEEGYFSYGPAEGLPEFRSSVAKFFQNRGVDCNPGQTLATNSAASAMYLTARFCLKPGDEALIFDPVDFLFKKSVEAAGARPVLVPIRSKDEKLDISTLSKYITPRTKMIGLCNPHNPLGKVYSREELIDLGNFAVEKGLWIMSDEIWSDIVYSPKTHTSIASLSPEIAAKTFTVYGFSKAFGLAGLRLGAMILPSESVFADFLEKNHFQTTAEGVSTLSQIAGIAALEKAQGWKQEFVSHLTKARDFVVEELNSIEGIQCTPPDGTYVTFAKLDSARFNDGAEAFVERMARDAKVALVPGSPAFFGPGAEGHFRLCFSTSMEILQEAISRMKDAL